MLQILGIQKRGLGKPGACHDLRVRDPELGKHLRRDGHRTGNNRLGMSFRARDRFSGKVPALVNSCYLLQNLTSVAILRTLAPVSTGEEQHYE